MTETSQKFISQMVLGFNRPGISVPITLINKLEDIGAAAWITQAARNTAMAMDNDGWFRILNKKSPMAKLSKRTQNHLTNIGILEFVEHEDGDLYRVNLEKYLEYMTPDEVKVEQKQAEQVQVTPAVPASTPEKDLFGESKETPVKTKKIGTADRFPEFWQEYPKQGRGARTPCEKKWRAKNLDEKADEIIAHVIDRRENGKKWNEGFIHQVSTFLNQELWTDEFERLSRNDGRVLSGHIKTRNENWDDGETIRRDAEEMGFASI